MSVILATDLDRTLFPNGQQHDDRMMPVFRRFIEERRIPLVFVTGRNLRQIENGMERYHAPAPDYAIAEVGTRFYRQDQGKLTEEDDFIRYIADNTRGWDVTAFQRALASLPLRRQPEENQNQFKLSYFLDDLDRAGAVRQEAAERLAELTPDARLIWSIDETEDVGLLDVLPRRANKMEALEYLRRRLDVPRESIVYCGDSGNDLLPLTHGYRAVLVANAIDEVRTEVEKVAREKGLLDRTYFAAGDPGRGLSGNYVSGILEGLLHFGILSEEEWVRLNRGG